MGYQVNPMELIQMIKNGKNPQQLVMSILQAQAEKNPIFNNLMQLAEKDKTQDIENFARNVLKQQGYDYDKEFNHFLEMFGYKK